MKGKYAFFVNKNKYIKLFGNIEKGKNAPSIKDIEENFHLDGYYIENNTKTLHLIGYDNLIDSEKKYHKRKSIIELETIINLNNEYELEQLLMSQFNYDRIIPYTRDRLPLRYKDGILPTVNDSFLCVIININYLASNKYINFIYKDINIIQERDPRQVRIEREKEKIESLPTNERNERLIRFRVSEQSRRARLDAANNIRYIQDKDPDIIEEKKKKIQKKLNAQLQKIKKQLIPLNDDNKKLNLESQDQEISDESEDDTNALDIELIDDEHNSNIQ